MVLSVVKIYVGILAATILFIATNAGVIGASRITYSMSSYRQLPAAFRKLHPKLKTPWLSLVVFAGIGPTLFLLSGQVDFLGRMYAFGAMLSFTIAHLAVTTLRVRRPDEELEWRARPNLTIRGVQWPLFAIVGAIGTGAAWLVVVVQDAQTRYAGLAWLIVGLHVLRPLPAPVASVADEHPARPDTARPGTRPRVPVDPGADRLGRRVARGSRARRPPRDRACGRGSCFCA